MLGLRLGVRAPVPQGVDASFREVSYGAWEYMPQSVEEVRFKMERVRCRTLFRPDNWNPWFREMEMQVRTVQRRRV